MVLVFVHLNFRVASQLNIESYQNCHTVLYLSIHFFQEAASAAGTKAGAKAGYEEAMKAAGRIALETAAKAAREKILAMASRREIKLSETWRPTSLIAVINMRYDLSQ